MKQQVKKGSLLDVDNGIIVHGCNSLGVMGAGVALQIARKWPEVLTFYQECLDVCSGNPLGRVYFYNVAPNLIVANAITQNTVGQSLNVDYKAIEHCFRLVVQNAEELNLPIHYPMIGAGLGGGDWTVIENIIDEVCSGYDVSRTLWIL
jgi:O-acetyl-ADP-ribose deacetylase (regulator of RNase III)